MSSARARIETPTALIGKPYPRTYEEFIARDQAWEDHWAKEDERPSKMQGWAYRWQETCPCCQHQFRIELDRSEGFGYYERHGYYTTECPECEAEIRYPFELEYVASLGKREIVKVGTVPDPSDADDEATEDTSDEDE